MKNGVDDNDPRDASLGNAREGNEKAKADEENKWHSYEVSPSLLNQIS
ncbi:hypothetical protein [Hymenobacter volaticus]|uniref:Uncharacterized protein n=1 Tax=Hymenobacter volaticus TaxID=2932254 RepID=A0ABY4GGX1_9BACT|nr:hypothetical protein [Hymenobacter volaticus]UOQ69907.1 hypothetical protein MUN86_30870 [Hymenobacter volaticus]